jgi:hypothetical protein
LGTWIIPAATDASIQDERIIIISVLFTSKINSVNETIGLLRIFESLDAARTDIVSTRRVFMTV